MVDTKGIIRSADNGINTGAHPANIPDGQIIAAKNMFVRGRGRVQQARFPTFFGSSGLSTQYPVLDQISSPTYTDITNVSGLQDAVFSGVYDETQIATALKIKVAITGTGAPDTIEWYYDTGSGYGAAVGTSPILGGGNPISSTGVTVTFGATTGHTLNDYWEFYAVPILVTNGSASVTSMLDLTDTTYVAQPIQVGCGFYYKDGPAYPDEFAWYRVTAVASDGLSFTLDRDFGYQTQGLTQRSAGYVEHFITFPVTAVINWDNTNDEEQTCAVAGKYLKRWNGAGWDTEYTLSYWNEKGMFVDFRGQCLFTNGKDEILRSYTGDGDWDELTSPVIEKMTVQHTESGHHNGIAEFTNVDANSQQDAVFSGTYNGAQTNNVLFRIRITGIGTGTGGKDEFTWEIDTTGTGASYGATTTLDCETTAQQLGAHGVYITFKHDGTEGGTYHYATGTGDEYVLYSVYEDSTTYDVYVEDCVKTPTNALVASGRILDYDIGNSKTTYAVLLLRSLNKGQAWTTKAIHYHPYEDSDVTVYAGGMFIRKSGDIITSIAHNGIVPNSGNKVSPAYKVNFNYLLKSDDDGDTWDGVVLNSDPVDSNTIRRYDNGPASEYVDANPNVFVWWSDYSDAGLDATSNAIVPIAYTSFGESITPDANVLAGGGLLSTGYAVTFELKESSGAAGFAYTAGGTKHLGRPLFLSPVTLYDKAATGEDISARPSYIQFLQGDDTSDPKVRAEITAVAGERELSTTTFKAGNIDFTYGSTNITPKGYPAFGVGPFGPRISKDIGVLGTASEWSGWNPVGAYKNRVRPVVAWLNESTNFYYALSKKNISGVHRFVLSVSDDEGETFSPVWQDADNNVVDEHQKRVLHWDRNEFIIVSEDSPYMYRCRYHVNAPKCKNLLVWRQRLLAYGELLDLVSPRGATPDNDSFATPLYTIRYQGMNWFDNELVGMRLYPDIVGNPTVYYTITSNTSDEVTVGTDISSLAAANKVFEIREYAPERIRISGINRFDEWDPEDSTDEDDKVMAIRPYLQTGFETPQSGLLILMEEGHALYLGNRPEAWVRYSGKTQRGCIGPYAIAENILLSHDALSVINEGQPTPLAGRLDTTLLQEASPSMFIETLNENYKTEAFGFLGKGLEFLCVTTGTNPWPDTAIALDVLRGGFWKIDFPTYGGGYAFFNESNTAVTHPVPVCSFSDKSGYVIYSGCVSGVVWKLFDSKTGLSIGDEVDTTFDITLPLNLGAPEEWFGVRKIGFFFHTADGGTLSYRFNPNMSGWTAWETKTMSAGMNRVIISAPQPMEGNTIALQMKFTSTAHVELALPVEFSADLKHSGIEEG